MDTLFFLISIIGLIVITFWAYRNDQRTEIAEQDGVLAIKLPRRSEDQNQTQNQEPSLAAKPSPPSCRPARRRFVSP